MKVRHVRIEPELHDSDESLSYPLLPLRDVGLPHMVIPLFVGRPKSIKALEVAMESGKHILLGRAEVCREGRPTPEDLYETGCVATVLQMLKLPDGTVKVLVEGLHRAPLTALTNNGEFFSEGVRAVPRLRMEPPKWKSLALRRRCSPTSISLSS